MEIAGWIGGGEGESAHLQEGKIAQIDRHIRLFLGSAGPRYMVPSQAEQYRRNGYAYYDETFAELVYSIAARPNVKGRPRAIREALLEHYIRIGCESAFLIPSRQSFYQRVLEDVLPSTPVQNMRDRCLAYLTRKGEFEDIRQDGTYKVIMPMTNQPKHGAKMRKSEEKERPGRLHVAHTLTTATGATVGWPAEFSKSRKLTLGFIARRLDVSTSDVRPVEHVRILYSYKARGLDRVYSWRAMPNLDAVASDPLHRCLEIEACSGGRRAALSSALRKIHMQLPPELPPQTMAIDTPGVQDTTAGRKRGQGAA